jgi:hypothetical protein
METEITSWTIRSQMKFRALEKVVVCTREEAVNIANEIAARRPLAWVTLFRTEFKG